MAVAGHVSTSENAPGAANTEWMPLQVASGAVTTTFVDGATITPSGDYGVSIAGNAPNKNILTNITPTGITIQSEEGSGTITKATYAPEEYLGPFPCGREEEGYICSYGKKNGWAWVSFRLYPNVAITGYDIPIFTLPAGFRPSVTLHAILLVTIQFAGVDLIIAETGEITLNLRELSVSNINPALGYVCFPCA